MTIQQIQYFLMAAEKMSFTETAKVMYVSQQADFTAGGRNWSGAFSAEQIYLTAYWSGGTSAAFFSKTFQEYREIRNELKTDAHKLSGVVTL